MKFDSPRDPSLSHTYNGFSGPRPAAAAPPPPQAPEHTGPATNRKALILAGVAGACGLGLLLGVMARPDLVGGRSEPMRAASVNADAAASDGGMQIVVDKARTPPPVEPAASGPLEVLPADMAAATAPSAIPAPRGPVRVNLPPAPSAEAADRFQVPAVVEIPPPQAQSRPRPSFDCRYARSRSEEMVCGDPSLAEADRRLARAFRGATEAGVPYRQLRAEQDDWLSIREAAARRSPEAVASIYDQRIEELEAMAQDEWEE